jgi:hypothetical protein
MPTKEKRYGISINMRAADALKQVQAKLEREIGFTPSMSQAVEYLAIQHTKPIGQITYIPQDNLTGGHYVK